MKIALVSPFPPDVGGIAIYSNNLLKELRQTIKVATIGNKKSDADYKIDLSAISLKKEIETLMLYVELEQKRFKDRFEVEFNCDDRLDQSSIQVPTMIIQPYVENAIWHGIMNMPKTKQGKLSVSFSADGDGLIVVIEDNGAGREFAAKKKIENEYKSVGMLYSQKRMDLLQEIRQKETKIKVTDLYNVGGDAIGTRVELKFESG